MEKHPDPPLASPSKPFGCVGLIETSQERRRPRTNFRQSPIPAKEDCPMTRREYRNLPRITTRVSVEVEILPPGKLQGRKELCASENVSAAGICFVTSLPLAVGTYLRLLFMMPQEVSRWAALPYEFTGKVLRVERISGSDEMLSVAIMLIALADVPAKRAPRSSAQQDECERPAVCA